MKLHASGEDYLETILVLQKKLGMVRSVDVARHMEVSKPSVCHAVATLRDGGFLTIQTTSCIIESRKPPDNQYYRKFYAATIFKVKPLQLLLYYDLIRWATRHISIFSKCS